MRNTSLILLACLVVGLAEISLATRNRDSRRRPATSSSASTNTSCPPRRRSCTKDCGTRGFMRNENGCEICACQPVAGCPAIECPDSQGVCPFGWREDENGCRLCECRTSPRCSAASVSCMMSCPLGFRNGPDGCPTCQCFDPESASQLPAPEPAHEVQRGHRDHRHHNRDHAASRSQHRHNGATSGGPAAAQLPVAFSATSADEDSSAAPCPPICLMFCPNGMKTDANGCAICECNDGEESTTPAPGGRPGGSRRGTGAGRPWRRRGPQCHSPTCAMYCPNGNRRDANGCTLCECQQPGDAPIQIPTSPSLQCPELRCHRFKKCAHGFVTDAASGCPSCACRTSA